MDTYYSIISASIRPEINESLSIGFLLMGKGSVQLLFSKTKISIARQLMSENRFSGLNSSIKEFTREFNNHDNTLGKEGNIDKSPSLINQIKYLSNYSNNLILFSTPTIINITNNSLHFEILFKKFIDESYCFESAVSRLNDENYFSEYKSIYADSLSKYYNANHSLTYEDYPNLIFPVKLDYLGKNSAEVFVKEVRLERSTKIIQKDLSDLLFLKNAVPQSKRFILSKEPDRKKFKQQHDIWKHIYKNSQTWEYIDVREVIHLVQYAKKHNVVPLFEKEVQI